MATVYIIVQFCKITIYLPYGRSVEIPCGRGWQKKEKYGAKLEFLEGLRVQTKKPSVGEGGGYEIVWNTK